jgi:hypothetical protein
MDVSGSYRGQQYAAKYPCRIGNFVLDAVTPAGLVSILTKFSVRENVNINRAFFIKPIRVFSLKTERFCAQMRTVRMIQTVL